MRRCRARPRTMVRTGARRASASKNTRTSSGASSSAGTTRARMRAATGDAGWASRSRNRRQPAASVQATAVGTAVAPSRKRVAVTSRPRPAAAEANGRASTSRQRSEEPFLTLPETPDTGVSRRRRRVALPLAAIVLILTVAGALWITRFASEVRRDPGLVYRDPGTLDRLLKRGHDAEAAGDRGTAITTYRFVGAVGGGARGEAGRTCCRSERCARRRATANTR